MAKEWHTRTGLETVHHYHGIPDWVPGMDWQIGDFATGTAQRHGNDLSLLVIKDGIKPNTRYTSVYAFRNGQLIFDVSAINSEFSRTALSTLSAIDDGVLSEYLSEHFIG